MKFRLPYPGSFLRLVLLGFVLTGLPLLAGLLYSAWSLERLAKESQAAIYAAAQAAHASRSLAEDVTAMERGLRQYVILGDADLLDGYRQARERYQATVLMLASLAWEGQQQRELRAMVEQESRLHALLGDTTADRQRIREGAERFEDLAAQARRVALQVHALIDQEAGRLRARVDVTRQRMASMLLASLPVAFILLAALPRVIARPVRQIDAAIGRLRAGELNTPVRVEGPRDLRYVGERLEWMRQGLLATEADRTRFLRHLSHELKTPLTALREGSELLRDEVGGPLTEGQRELVDILRQNGLKLQKRIEDLLDYSALLSTPSRPQPVPVRVGQVVDRVAADNRAALLAKGLEVRSDCDQVELEADPAMFRVIVDNLVTNAIKFSPARGAIQVRAGDTGDQVFLEVVDQGPGVAAEDKPRIFDAFYQGRQADAASVRGTGLGLSITREYVLAHGGRIEVSDAPGGGALFRVLLPQRQV